MEIMSEESYWSIIDDSLKSTNNQEEQQTFLTTALGQLPPPEIIGFYLRTVEQLNETYTSEMWCAATIMNGRTSDDGFEDFRCWVISRGKEVYYKAKENPDSLVSEVVEGRELYEFESFGYTAMDAYEEKTGDDLMDTLEDNHLLASETPFTPIEFNWRSDDPESMKKACPNLYQQFRG